MIARGFKPVGWVAAVGTAALGCYMLSLRVASERADLSGLQRRIVATQQQIRSLQTELGTRGRLQQLEQWNDEVLALAAPVAGQYLHADVRLARFGTVPAAPLETPEVRMAAAETAPAPAPAAAPAAPAARHAVADPRSLAPPPPLERPMVQRTSLTLAAAPPGRTDAAPPVRAVAPPARKAPAPAAAAAAPTVRTAAAAPARTAVAAPVRTAVAAPVRTAAAVPARTRTAAAEPPRPARSSQSRPAALLDERTLREIGSAARAERGGGGTRD